VSAPISSLSLPALADALLDKVKLWENPYFRDLDSGTLTKRAFRISQEQFYFAVTFFSRPKAGLIARLPDFGSRIHLLQNVLEEHGEFHFDASHPETFLGFLTTLGSTPEQVRTARPIAAVHAFNSVLYSACLLEEVEIGIACFAVIEHALAKVSSRIADAVVKMGWIEADQLVHYGLLATVDARHAEDFFTLLEPKWDQPENRELITRGLALGAYSLDRLYRDLHSLGS
jgi:pyrroloquinoline-quinone synthase